MKKVLRFLTLAVLLAAPWGGYFNQVQAQQSLPYSYGFEDNNLATDGWTMVDCNSSTGISSSAAQTGSYGFSFHWNDPGQILISPELATSSNSLTVSFGYKAYSDYYDESFMFGYSTTTADASSFTWSSEVVATTSWQTYEESAPVGTKYIAIKCMSDDAYYLYVDDITIEVASGCAKPTGLTATVTPGSGTIATLNWTAGGTETEWTVEYSTSADFSSGVSSTTATGTPTANLTGLTPETQYYARVKAVCGVGDESSWSNTVTFTPSNAYTLTVNDGSTTNGYVPIYGYYVDASIVSQFIIPAASLSSIQWATLSGMTFYATQSSINWGSAQFEVYVTEVDYTTFTGTTLVDWTTMTKVMNAGSLSVSGNQMVVTFDTPYQYTGGNLMIGVKQTVSGDYVSSTWQGVSATGASLGGNSTGSQQNFLPKVTFAFTPGVAPSCTKPTGLAASSITSSSATLDWTAGGTETAWVVEYGTAADFTGALFENVSTNPTLDLTGLTPASTYYVRVKAACGVSDESDWSNAATFATECAAIAAVGYTQNFDALTAGNNVLPLCWSYINTTTYSSYQGYPKAYADSYYSTYSQSAPNCLYLYSYAYYYSGSTSYDPQPQYAILPEMTGLSGKQVTLSAKGSNASSTFKIGTMSDPANAATFTEIAEQTLTTSYQEFAYLVPTTTDAYLAIMIDAADASRTTNGVYIDDISIAEPPSCPKPTALVLETPTARTAHTATLTWTNGDAETAWQIAYIASADYDADVDIDESNGWTIVDVTTKPYTLTGLSASTTYYAYVRANCGGGDYSAWCTTKATFTTTNGIGTPTGLAVDNATLSYNTATVTWSRVATNDLHESFDIYFSTDGTAPTAETVPTYTGITAMTYTFTGLSEATTYYVWVRDVCGTDGNSAWSSRLTITTTVFCPAPTGVTVSSATAHGATISWTGTSDSYNVYVGKATITSNDATYDFEDNAISADFTNDATYAWTVTTSDKHAGTYAIKSASGFTSTQSDLTLTVEVGDGATITFWDKASSESGYDYGRFLLDGVQKHQTSGTSDSWTERTYELTAGSHTLVWRYYKDVSGNSGDDCYYVDDITITNIVTVDVPSWERYSADASPYLLNDDGNIDPETDYAVKVVGVCEDMESTHESATVLFTTSADCGASNAVVSNIGYHSADVAWDGSSDAGYMVMLGYEDGIANDFVDEDFAGGVPTSAEWTNDATYPWTAVDGYIKSGNAGQSNSTSQISVTVDMDAAGYVEFDAECRGEGTGTSYYDKCIFSIDASDQFTYGAQRTSDGFVHYSFPVAAGTHTFVWKYSKDSSVDPDGDYMAIDNLHIYTTNITWDEVEVVDVNNYTFDGLEDGTQYFVKISPECDRAIESNAADFTTVALPSISVMANKWYALSSPMHDAGQTYESVGNVQNLTTGTYDFLRYDEPSSTWESQKSGAGHTGFSTLEPGRGYIYRRANDAVLKIDGEPNTGNVNVAVTKDRNGWNLIGNPYLTTIRLNSTYIAPASTAALIDGGYKLNTNGTWTAIYSSSDIVAGQAVLVKASTAGTLTLRPTASKSASADEQESARGFVFSVSNAEYSDVAYALFADGEGLPKIAHLNTEAPMLSIDGYAIAKLDVNAERFPMSFNGQGKYTLALKENSAAAGYLHLIDRATGRDIDLLTTPEYTFVGTGMADRFEVRLMPGMDENGNVTFVHIDGNRLIVDGEGELQVFDVMGRQLGSAQVSGTATLDRNSLGIVGAGVYVMRLGGQSQKIVVK